MLALALLAFAAAGPIGAMSTSVGRFVSVCDFSHQSKNDPIALPGRRGLAHLHHFFGNRSTNHRSTPRKLRRKRDTTCDPADDRSVYWAPALIVHDEPVEPSSCAPTTHPTRRIRARFSRRQRASR